MSFYGNIVNYFSAAFKRFKFRNNTENKNSEEYNNVEALLSQDELYFDSTSENYIEYHYKENQETGTKTVDMQLNVNALDEKKVERIIINSLPENNEYPSSYEISSQTTENSEIKKCGEIKYYAKYDENTGNLYIPFIHVKEETE